jgi:2-polyprenyl-3-methyl-5-hydroxy-6-metoxy-1,4-benzoquinol methylase
MGAQVTGIDVSTEGVAAAAAHAASDPLLQQRIRWVGLLGSDGTDLVLRIAAVLI